MTKKTKTLSNKAIIEGIKKDDIAAIKALYQLAEPIVFKEVGYAYKGKTYAFDADDILQKTVLRIIEYAKNERGKIYFLKGFIKRVARGKWSDSQEQAQKWSEKERAYDYQQQFSDDAIIKEKAAEVKKIIQEFCSECEEIIRLYYENRWTMKSIADYYKINEESAKQRVFRCRRKIKAEVQKIKL